MSAKIDLSQSVAGNVRVYVGKECFAKWYRVHTGLHSILREALQSPSLRQFNLSPREAIIKRLDLDIGLVEIEQPGQ